MTREQDQFLEVVDRDTAEKRWWDWLCPESFGFVSVALAISLTPLEFEEERVLDFDFQVADEDSGRPIAGVFLRLSNPFDADWPTSHALTDRDGRARLTGRFAVFGERNAFRSMGAFSPWGCWLEVSAVHHQTLHVALTEVLGPHVELGCGRVHQVGLAKGKTPAGSFRDVAGLYLIPSRGFGGSHFTIEPDGRFAWSISGCVPPDFQQYGYLKRNEGEIELVRIPHPGAENDPALNSTVRVIGWGDQLYLSASEDRGLRDFCREALGLTRREAQEYTSEGYVRVASGSDHAKPCTGLPRIPLNVWVKVLPDELRFRNKDGSLRLALESMTQRDDDLGNEQP